MPKTFIVPVDRSQPAERAIGVARTLAERFDRCDIVLLTATHDDDAVAARRYLDMLVELAGPSGVRAELVERTGAADAITRAAAEAPDAVVCMATHGRGRIATPFLGSVATDVLGQITVPVVLVGPQCDAAWWREPPRVLVGWAGEASNAVLAPAHDWARALGAEIWLESVFHPLDTRMAENPRAELEPALERLGPDPAVHLLTVAGEYPAGAILQSARDLPATLIAMTTHARGGVARAVLGSTTMQVAHQSTCPVLVVGVR